MKQFKLQEWHAKDASRRLMRDRKILDDFLTYSRTHQLPILSVRKDGGADEYTALGYTVTGLMRDYDLAPVGAFLMLSELSSNPEEGKIILQQIERHGYMKMERNSKGDIVRALLFRPHPVRPAQQPFAFCENCGKQIPADSVFCVHCGDKQGE